MSDLISPGHWDSRGTSLWCVVARLIDRNSLNAREIRRCFYTNSAGAGFGGMSQRSLATFFGLDERFITQAAKLPKRWRKTCFPECFTLAPTSISNYLRFCPMCLHGGFHSALFQVESYGWCPWHGTLLEGGEEWESELVPYEFCSQLVTDPACVDLVKESLEGVRIRGLPQRHRVLTDLLDYRRVLNRLKMTLANPGDSNWRRLPVGEAGDHEIPILLNHMGERRSRQFARRCEASPRTMLETRRYQYQIGSYDPDKGKKDLVRISRIWNADHSYDHRNAVETLVGERFTRSLDTAMHQIAKRFLASHTACWCMAHQVKEAQFALGMSCIWRSGFELWLAKRWPTSSVERGSSADRKHEIRAMWTRLIEDLLIDQRGEWRALLFPDLVLKIIDRVVIDYLQRGYVEFITQLADLVKMRRGPTIVTDADDVLQSIEPPQLPMYLLRMHPTDDLLVLTASDPSVSLRRAEKLARTQDHDIRRLSSALTDRY